MPRPRKGKIEKENWSWNGFVVGLVFGAPIYLSSIGFYDNMPLARAVSSILVIFGFICALIITVSNMVRQKPFFNPLVDGLIAGFCFSATLADWYLHGVHLP